MNKNLMVLGLVAILASVSSAFATDSTIYTDNLGRMHFMGKGGYSGVRHLQMGEMQAGAINDAVEQHSTKKEEIKEAVEEKVTKEIEKTETDITSVIKEKPVVPAAAHKSTFSYQKGGMDPSNPYGFAGTNIPAGVNESKTIYTDGLGRLHFFGKANQIKD